MIRSLLCLAVVALVLAATSAKAQSSSVVQNADGSLSLVTVTPISTPLASVNGLAYGVPGIGYGVPFSTFGLGFNNVGVVNRRFGFGFNGFRNGLAFGTVPVVVRNRAVLVAPRFRFGIRRF